MMHGHAQQGVSTSVVNGDVYINGEFVTRVPPGGPVSLDSSNGVVRLNGNVVWPRTGEEVEIIAASGLPPEVVAQRRAAQADAAERRQGASNMGTMDDWRRQQRQAEAWLPPEGTLEVLQPIGDTADVPFAPPLRRHQANPSVEEATPVRAEEESVEEATRVAYRSSCEGSCPRDHPEPCSVCLDDIKVGQQIRTLPCFHFLHAQCAAAHFARPSVLERGAHPEVVCPVCRVKVGPESTEL